MRTCDEQISARAHSGSANHNSCDEAWTVIERAVLDYWMQHSTAMIVAYLIDRAARDGNEPFVK
jgi:hypothetical protein